MGMQRHLVIGDVHGCHQELLDLCDRAAVAEGDVLVSVGDLVDRGPSPRETVRFFRERAAAVVLMGNHERKHVRQVCSYAQDVTRLQMGEEYESFVAWASALPYFYETDAARVVHAAMMPGVPLAMQREDVLAGTTSGEAFLESELGGVSWHELLRGAGAGRVWPPCLRERPARREKRHLWARYGGVSRAHAHGALAA